MEFDNDLFELSSDNKSIRQKRKEIALVNNGDGYTPKQCPPEWFMPIEDIKDDDYMILKYKGDLLYYREMYRDALIIYKNILSSIPPTHGQIKRELQDSIVRCMLHCDKERSIGQEKGREEEKEVKDKNREEEDDIIKWGNLLIQRPHDKDASSWQLLANCYRHKAGNTLEEVLARAQCCLLQRHYATYWEELSHSYHRLSIEEISLLTVDQISQLIQIKVMLFRPYVKSVDQNPSQEISKLEQHKYFIYLICGHVTDITDLSSILQLSSCLSLIWAKQLLSYSCSHSNSFASDTQSVKYQDICEYLTNNYPPLIIEYLTECIIKATILDL